MIKRKFISMILVLTLILTCLPFASAEPLTQSENEFTYDTLRDAANTLLQKIANENEQNRKLAVAIFRSYVQEDGGIAELQELILGMSNPATSVFGEEIATRVKNGLAARGVSLSDAAQAMSLLEIFEIGERIAIVESLDSSNPVQFFATESEASFINEVLGDFPDIETLFASEGISLDEFSFFAFLAQKAIDKPLFVDGTNGDTFALTSGLDVPGGLFDKFDASLNGITIKGKTYTHGAVENVFTTFVSLVNQRIENSAVENAAENARSIFSKYDLYQSTNPTIKLVPVFDVVTDDDTTDQVPPKAYLNVVLRNFDTIDDLQNIQIDVNYADYTGITSQGELSFGSFNFVDLVDFIKTQEQQGRPLIGLYSDDSTAKVLSIALTGPITNLQSEVLLGTIEFDAIDTGYVGFSVADYILSDSNNVNIVAAVEDYGALVDIRDASAPVPVDVNLQMTVNGKNFDDNNTAKIGTTEATFSGVVVPFDTPVVIKGHTLTGDEINTTNGNFSYTITLNEGSNAILVTAGNFSKTYTVIVDSAIPDGTVTITPNTGTSNDPEFTNSNVVDFNISTSNTDIVYVSNTAFGPGVNGTMYTPDASGIVSINDWTLTAGEGLKTVYVKLVKDLVGTTDRIVFIQDTITVDTTSPTVTSVSHTAAGKYNLKPGSVFTISANYAQNEQVQSAVLTIRKEAFDGKITTQNFNMNVTYGKAYYNYTVPTNNDFSIVGFDFELIDKAANTSNHSEDLAEAITFMGSLAVTFKDGSGNPVTSLGFSLSSASKNIQRYGSIYTGNTYNFTNLPVADDYVLEWYPIYNKDSYVEGTQSDLSVNSGHSTNYVAVVQPVPSGTLTITVNQEGGGTIQGAQVYVYSYDNSYYWDMKTTGANGQVTFDDIPISTTRSINVNYDVYAGSYANGQGTVTFAANDTEETVTVNLPESKHIQGTVIGANGPLQNVEVWANNGDSWSYVRTAADGKFDLAGLTGNNATVGVYSFRAASDGVNYLYAQQNNVTPGALDATNITFNLKPASKITGTVTYLDTGAPASNVYVYAQPDDTVFNTTTGWPTYGWAVTNADGTFTMDGLKAGNYDLTINYVTDYEDYTESVIVPDEDTYTHPGIGLARRAGNTSFTGAGNSLTADRQYVAPSGFVRYSVKYKNNNVATNGIDNVVVKVQLPNGFTFVDSATPGVNNAGQVVSYNVGHMAKGETGTFTFTAKANKNIVAPGKTYTAVAKADWDTGEAAITESFAVSSVEILTATLNGPNKVKESTFKLYGEASSNAEILIFEDNGDGTSTLVAVAKAMGKYWVANVSLDPVNDTGSHVYYAQSRINNQLSSPTGSITVEYDPDYLELDEATVEAGWNGLVTTNPDIGVVTLSVSQFQEMEVRAHIAPNGTTTLSGGVQFEFGGQTYNATAAGNNWYEADITVGNNLSGTQKLTVLFTDTNTKEYSIPLANIIILIDPSGYVYDAVTGDRLDGMTATLYEYNTATASWRIWDAAAAGQINPQTTSEAAGEHGKYGWDVPGGDGSAENPTLYYRVNISDPNGVYAPYNTSMEDKWVDDAIGIAVLPARFDVNMGIVDQTAPLVTNVTPTDGAATVAYEDNITITFNKKMDGAALAGSISVIEKATGTPVAGAVTYDAAAMTATFNPDAELKAATEYEVTVDQNLESAHDVNTAGMDAAYITYLENYNQPLGADYIFSFTTSDAVSNTTPADGSNNFGKDSNIVVTYNKDMNQADLQDAAKVKLYVNATDAEVAATLTYDAASKALTVNPDASLQYSTTYRLEIIGVTDADGNAVNDFTLTFTTEAAPVDDGGDDDDSSGGGGGGVATVTKETKSVGTSGGKLEFMKGKITINIPQGTFSSNIKITVEEVDQEDVKLPTQTSTTKLMIAGQIYEFSAQDKNFAKPVTITLPYSSKKVTNANKLGVYYYNESTKQWEYVGGKVNTANKTVTVSLKHFSKYAVMEFNKNFTDIANHWSKNDVELMAAKHIANGMTETTFVPDGNITRAQFATLLVRALGLDLTATSSSFTDVSDGEWYAPYVMTAYEAGLVTGMDAKTFAPETNITREQMAVMIMRAYNILEDKDYNELMTTAQIRFTDETEISSWAHHAVLVANDMGIINGMTANTFVPKAKATRAQGIVMIKRLLDSTDSL